jgi:hypothetical protein
MPLPAVSHCVAHPEARGGAERVRVIDEPAARDGHGLEAPVRVLRKSRYNIAVIHRPAVFAREVLADVSARERRRRPERVVALWVGVVVVHAEQERVGGDPDEIEPLHGQNAVSGHHVHEHEAGASQ